MTRTIGCNECPDLWDCPMEATYAECPLNPPMTDEDIYPKPRPVPLTEPVVNPTISKDYIDYLCQSVLTLSENQMALEFSIYPNVAVKSVKLLAEEVVRLRRLEKIQNGQ